MKWLFLVTALVVSTAAGAQTIKPDPMAFTLRRLLNACEGRDAQGHLATGAEEMANRVGCATWLGGFIAASVMERYDLAPCVDQALITPSLSVGLLLQQLRLYAEAFPKDLDKPLLAPAAVAWKVLCPVR